MNLENEYLMTPYNDWFTARTLGTDLDFGEGLTVRYRALQDIGTEKPRTSAKQSWSKPIEIPDLKESPLLTLTEVRRTTTAAFSQEVNNNFGRAGQKISAETGINTSFISKYLHSAINASYIKDEYTSNDVIRYPHMSVDCRPFSIPLIQMHPVANYVMKSSIHEMFFGEKEKIVLSHYHTQLANALSKLSDTQLDKIYDIGKILRDNCIQKYKDSLSETDFDASMYGQTKPMNKLLYERIHEAATTNSNISGTKYILNKTVNGPEGLKVALKKVSSEENRQKEPENAFEPHIELFMFLAFEGRQAMDYYLSNDYIYIAGGFSKNAPAIPRLHIYSCLNNILTRITNTRILQILSISTSLDLEEKTILDSEILKYDVLHCLQEK